MRLRTQVAIIAGVAVVALGTTGAVSYTLGTSGGKPAGHRRGGGSKQDYCSG